MRRSSLLILLLFVLVHGLMGVCLNRSRADDSSVGPSTATDSSVVSDPYLVFVAEEAAHLRCGPSGEYYRTDPLRHGQELEVYVETSDGWLGVRPTDDSFCWIPADTVKLLNARDADSRGAIRLGSSKNRAIEAEVLENKTVAWIGTNLGRARRYRWQVQLGEGEIVTVLGSSERDGPDGPQTWYRIVPPSGEFRWVHRDQTVTTAEDLIASVRNSNDSESIEFLPGGPSVVTANSRATQPQPSDNQRDPIRQVSNEQVWETPRSRASEPSPNLPESEGSRGYTVDDIEQRIATRQRSRMDLVEREDDSIEQDEQDATQASHNGHHLESFSQRVTRGFSSLMKGRGPNAAELQPVSPDASIAQLEPIAQSSRRVPDLVPIGSGLAAVQSPSNTAPIAAATRSQNGTPVQSVVPSQTTAPVENLASFDSNPMASLPSVSPSDYSSSAPKNVEATSQPGLRSNESQVAFLSSPRMVTPANTSMSPSAAPLQAAPLQAAPLQAVASIASLGSPTPPRSTAMPTEPTPADAPGRFLPPTRVRTIQADQLERVRRSVAEATPETLPVELSKLMARGASSPEIALVAEAAQQFGNRELMTRARDYQMLARRRDGDTVVAPATAHGSLAMGPVLTQLTFPGSAASIASTPSGAPSSSLPPLSTGGQFVERNQIAKTSFTPTMIPTTASQEANPVFEAAPNAATGVLVEVYSADPSRPPYAITDRGGRTIAYVTPAPGVDVKQHLGSEVNLTGESGYLQGLDTPHVLATSAERSLR